MSRIKLIINPWADRGRAGDNASTLRGLIDEFVANPPYGGGPFEVSWVGTVYPGQATDYAQEAAEAGYDIVTAVGGDGTVHEVVNGLMRVPAEKRPTLGMIPLGSGNDFAFGVGLPLVAGEAVKHLFEGTTRMVDAAKITDGSGRSEYFDNTAHIGFGGAVSIASRKITRIYGFAMYLTATLQTVAVNYHAPKMKITLDDETFERQLTAFVIANGSREGGGFNIAPDAEMDDGILDYVFVEKVGRVRILRLLPDIMNGTHLRHSVVKTGKTKRLSIESDIGLPIHADGEIFGPWEADIRRIDVEIIPGALTVAV